MKLLAFDTATTGCSAAYFEEGAVRAHRAESMPRGQSEALMPMIDDVLARAGRTYADLDGLAVTVGPGAFTGLRIGLAAARGLALTLNLPIAGVTTLEAIVHGVAPEGRRDGVVLAALDSKRSDVYAQAFNDDLRPLSEPAALDDAGLVQLASRSTSERKVLIVGDVETRVLGLLSAHGIVATTAGASGIPDAAILATIVAARGLPDDRTPPAPVYLRPPDATVPVHGGRLRP